MSQPSFRMGNAWRLPRIRGRELDDSAPPLYPRGLTDIPAHETASSMKIRNSLKSLKDRHRDNRVIRRRGRTYVINKTQRRFKARQG